MSVSYQYQHQWASSGSRCSCLLRCNCDWRKQDENIFNIYITLLTCLVNRVMVLKDMFYDHVLYKRSSDETWDVYVSEIGWSYNYRIFLPYLQEINNNTPSRGELLWSVHVQCGRSMSNGLQVDCQSQWFRVSQPFSPSYKRQRMPPHYHNPPRSPLRL